MEHTQSVALQNTKTFFDYIDRIDRRLYGKRMHYVINGALCILILAPFVDWWLDVPHDRLTYYSTLVYLLFMIVLVLGWISTFRNDDGNWTWNKVFSRLKTYYEVLKDNAAETKSNSQAEGLYRLARFLIVVGIIAKALHNLSVFIRKPLEHFTDTHRTGMRHFEHDIHKYYWIGIVIGMAIIVWLYYNDKNILARIKNEIAELFGRRNDAHTKYTNEIARIDTDRHVDLVIDTKDPNHMQVIVSNSESNLFNDFALALSSWQPQNCRLEHEFQNSLFRHLKRTLKGVEIELERPIGDPSVHNKGRADIVINDTILIEMKRDSSAGAIQRAKGQIMQYSHIWKDKGPVILLLCNYEYDHARLSYTPTMQDLLKLERSALTIVAN